MRDDWDYPMALRLEHKDQEITRLREVMRRAVGKLDTGGTTGARELLASEVGASSRRSRCEGC